MVFIFYTRWFTGVVLNYCKKIWISQKALAIIYSFKTLQMRQCRKACEPSFTLTYNLPSIHPVNNLPSGRDSDCKLWEFFQRGFMLIKGGKVPKTVICRFSTYLFTLVKGWAGEGERGFVKPLTSTPGSASEPQYILFNGSRSFKITAASPPSTHSTPPPSKTKISLCVQTQSCPTLDDLEEFTFPSMQEILGFAFFYPKKMVQS